MSKLKNYRNYAIVVLVVGLLGYATGRYLQPAKIEIKKEEIIKTVEVVKKDVVIRERIVKGPDGTETTERVIEDKSTSTAKKESETRESTVVTNKKPDWRAAAMAGLDLSKMQPLYGGQVERRVLGPIFVSGYVLTGPSTIVGVTAGIEF